MNICRLVYQMTALGAFNSFTFTLCMGWWSLVQPGCKANSIQLICQPEVPFDMDVLKDSATAKFSKNLSNVDPSDLMVTKFEEALST